MEEKIVTLNLRKISIKKARWKRQKFIIKSLKEILKKRTKSENIKIDKKINEKIWRSSKKLLTKMRLRLKKLEDGTIKVELVE